MGEIGGDHRDDALGGEGGDQVLEEVPTWRVRAVGDLLPGGAAVLDLAPRGDRGFDRPQTCLLYTSNSTEGGRRVLVLQTDALDALLDGLQGLVAPSRQTDPTRRAAGA